MSTEMRRARGRDYDAFDCGREQEFLYLSSLYAEQKKVYDFLKESCRNNQIRYATHAQVFQLVKNKFGFDIPA